MFLFACCGAVAGANANDCGSRRQDACRPDRDRRRRRQRGPHRRLGRATFIDFGGRYPNNTFTAVIFSRDVTKFSNVDALNGKTVDVTGPVRLHNGKPEIILNDPGQIKAK